MTIKAVKPKLRAIRRHFPEAVLLGALLAFISSLVIDYGYFEYFFDTYFVAWVCWIITLAIVLPAILDDDFYCTDFRFSSR